jgi:hypothetical protein
MDIIHKDITVFFDELLSDIDCQRDTKAYIVSIYGKYKSTDQDLSKDSITLLFAQARDKHNFLTYQNLSDWIFFTKSVAPEYLNKASKDYYSTVAQLSYYSCYQLINKQWPVFEELADNFNYLTNQTHKKLNNILK